jgi:hypothetical protein
MAFNCDARPRRLAAVIAERSAAILLGKQDNRAEADEDEKDRGSEDKS